MPKARSRRVFPCVVQHLNRCILQSQQRRVRCREPRGKLACTTRYYLYHSRPVDPDITFILTGSNNEKDLPDAFLRRCFFHYIQFPDDETMAKIVEVHFPGIKPRLLSAAMKRFYDVRAMPGLKKKPSTSELLDWLKLLLVEDIDPETLKEADPKKLIPPLHGALLKNEQDVHLFERLAFLSRREN